MRFLESLARAVVTSVYLRQLQYITVKRIDVPDRRRETATTPNGECACVVVESIEALRAIAHEIPAAFRDSVADLTRRIAQGCVVCAARLPREDASGHAVIGYELAERAVFSALGRRKTVGSDVVFSHWAEVLPEYRGRRIHGLLFSVRDAYFRERGGKIVVGVCAPRNRASLRALARDGAVIVGRVRQISLFRRLIVWETPWARIEEALDVGRYLGATTEVFRARRLAPHPV